MTRPAFLITVDTEGDDLWSAPRDITTFNSLYLPRFQHTCETYGLLPTYLTAYESAMCPIFRRFGRECLERHCCEIGMHLHAWNTPPLFSLTNDDFQYAPYLIEYPVDLMREKIGHMTGLLREAFGTPMKSHRAGRWALDANYVRILVEYEYRVDCSVTPGISWETSRGGSIGGSNYTYFPQQPYVLSVDDIAKPGNSGILEVPVTILPTGPALIQWTRRHFRPRSPVNRLLNQFGPPLTWMRPNGRNRRSMLRLLELAVERGYQYVEFMLHSSELMPAGSPTFQTEEAITGLYSDLDAVFSFVRRHFEPMTLSAFASTFVATFISRPVGDRE